MKTLKIVDIYFSRSSDGSAAYLPLYMKRQINNYSDLVYLEAEKKVFPKSLSSTMLAIDILNVSR